MLPVLTLILLLFYVVSVLRNEFSMTSVTIRFLVTHLILFSLLLVALGNIESLVPPIHYFFVFLPYFIFRVLFQLVRNKSINFSEKEKKIIILLPFIGIVTLTFSFRLSLLAISEILDKVPIIDSSSNLFYFF